MNQKGFANIILITAIIVLVLVAGGVVYYVNKQKTPTPAGQQQTQDETANWKTYRNEKYGFEVRYPPSAWFVSEQWQDFEKALAGLPSTNPAVGFEIATISITSNPDRIAGRVKIEATQSLDGKPLSQEFIEFQARSVLVINKPAEKTVLNGNPAWLNLADCNNQNPSEDWVGSVLIPHEGKLYYLHAVISSGDFWDLSTLPSCHILRDIILSIRFLR